MSPVRVSRPTPSSARVVEIAECAPCVVAQQFALGCQPHRTRRPLDQAHAENRFQALQRGAGGSRRQIELARGGTQRTGVGDADEQLQLRKGQVAQFHFQKSFEDELGIYRIINRFCRR
jgi:hypothetical protein